MCVVIKSRPEFKMGHVGSKTRSLGQFLEKPCVLSRRHSFDPVFMELCQNDFLTLNKRLSRRAMLSDDSSCCQMFSLFGSLQRRMKVRGPGFDTRSGNILSFLLPLFQEGQLSVTGESMCTKYWLTA